MKGTEVGRGAHPREEREGARGGDRVRESNSEKRQNWGDATRVNSNPGVWSSGGRAGPGRVIMPGAGSSGWAGPPLAPPPMLSSVTAPRQPHSQPPSPPSGAAGPAGPGRTPGTRTRPPGPAGGGIGGGYRPRGQPPCSSTRRSFGSWRVAPSGGCTGELGGGPGRGRGQGPERTPIPTRAQTHRWTGDTRIGGSTHLSSFLPPPPTAPLSLVLSCSSSGLFCWPHPTPVWTLFSGTVCSPLSGSLNPCPTSGALFTPLLSASFLWTSGPLSLGSLVPFISESLSSL